MSDTNTMAVPNGNLLKESRFNIWEEIDGDAYVFNGVSGGLLRVSADQRSQLDRFLAGAQSHALTSGILTKLVQGRMVVTEDCDELHLLRRRYEATSAASQRMMLTILPSLACNFGCAYCFEDKPPAEISNEVCGAIVRAVEAQVPTLKELTIVWFGGEPLLARRMIYALSDQLLPILDSHGIAYTASVITNGYHLDEETCEKLAARRVSSVQVGLDGPPEIHDAMRPLLGGQSTFHRVLTNVRTAANYFDVSVRVNVDRENQGAAVRLLQILGDEGLAGKVSVYLGHLVALQTNPHAPSASYGKSRCLEMKEFADVDAHFNEQATALGFSRHLIPEPTGAPCTAVRKNEWVVGPRGELWKCWDSVGDQREVVGSIFRLDQAAQDTKWSRYDPFSDDECRSCIALPTCMGGCAHHALEEGQRENRCGTFRFNHRDKVRRFVAAQKAPRARVIELKAVGANCG